MPVDALHIHVVRNLCSFDVIPATVVLACQVGDQFCQLVTNSNIPFGDGNGLVFKPCGMILGKNTSKGILLLALMDNSAGPPLKKVPIVERMFCRGIVRQAAGAFDSEAVVSHSHYARLV